MNLTQPERTAVNHLFQYLDARPGDLLFAYEPAYVRVARAVEVIARESNRDVELLDAQSVSAADLYDRLSHAEKFLCAFNRQFATGLSERVLVMTERATTRSAVAYTLADMSAVFFDVFQTCPADIEQVNAQLIRVLQQGRQLTITDPNGTHLDVALDPSFDWVNMDCFSEIGFDLTCNLPVGEVATYSPFVRGEIHFTGALLGTIPIGRKYGKITKPIMFEITDNAVSRILADDAALQRDLEFCLYLDHYTHLVNEVAVGTNPGVGRTILGYNYKYEENRQGFHLGFGASLAQQNVERLTPHHLDLVFQDSLVTLDGEVLFDGAYHLERFPAATSAEPLRIAARTCCGFAAVI